MLQIPYIVFFSLAFVMVGSAIGVIVHKNPIKNALFLIMFFVGLAGMFALLGSQFLATVQILVYVGAIMVLFLFVIMFIEVRTATISNLVEKSVSKWILYLCIILSFLMQLIVLLFGFVQNNKYEVTLDSTYTKIINSQNILSGNVEVVSYHLFSRYLIPFEAVSFLLLLAVIGALMLAKKDRRTISE